VIPPLSTTIATVTDELRLKASSRGDVVRALVLAIVYVAAARLGLALDAVSGFATLVWPASGIALAALVLFGFRLWPGILVGAMTANILVGAPILVAIGIGVGNTLEAIAGAYILRRVPGFDPALGRVRDALWLIVGAALLSTAIASTIGVTSLYLGGRVAGTDFMETLRAWWVGDAIGELLVAPFILAWATRGARVSSTARLLEAVALGTATIVVGLLVFMGPSGPSGFSAYLIFPIGIWGALRFGARGATTVVIIASVGAVWGTVLGYGPFLRDELHGSLYALQYFTCIVAVTLLVLAATISERSRAEEAARRAHLEAEEANRVKSEFLAVMSHELRTPLNAIGGYAELLTMGAHGPMSEVQLDSIQRIQRNQQHLHSLISDVLSFARMEAGKLDFDAATFAVNQALDDVEPLIQQEMRRKSISYVRHACTDDLRIVADREKLRQILLNFLTNAVKYSENGGTIAIAAERTNGTVTIWVKDSGIGIPQDQLARVFEPFFQVERGRTRRFSGIGLGLTIARDLARGMGGDVTIESESGRGTRVAVRVPAA
jgi:signal transduction histidine kinase